MPSIESSIVLNLIIDQYYGNNHFHVTMVYTIGVQIKEYGDFSSCMQHFHVTRSECN